MPNHLAGETSPYLRQHAGNPVDWYPWGAEALERARHEDRPILLSIGYAACHWCHVMERESFEDEGTARLMNEMFVNIKVDREERPDVDAIYMSAVQAMTGHGGWPMTMFLTPDGVPYYGGTYFPPDDRHGVPAFTRVLRSAADAYATNRDSVERTAAKVRQLYDTTQLASRPTGALVPALLDDAFRNLATNYDPEHGGFGAAPKFPQAMSLEFALRYWRRTGDRRALEIATQSYRRMARGGIYDHVGGGFHRYAVDAHWLVPHFEKMLYDNALLARLGAHLWQATGDEEFRRTVIETVDWVAAEMTAPDGGFYSSLDADSEGVEGRFYVWSSGELEALLGAGAAAMARAYWGVTAGGNFEGMNILSVPDDPSAVAARFNVDRATLDADLARARATLATARARRVRPALDDKVLAGWNGLMLRTVAECARIFDRADYRALAVANGEFLFRTLVQGGRVLRSSGHRAAPLRGYLEDHAAVALGALALYELTFEARWLERAREVAGAMVTWFWDEDARVFYDTARDAEPLIARPREVTDNALPSGTSLAAELLLRLGDLLDDAAMRDRAGWVLETLAEPMARYAAAFGHLLGVADVAIHGATEVALVGPLEGQDFRRLEREVAAHYLPALVLAGGLPPRDAGVALLTGRAMQGGRATAYVCRAFVCEVPVTETARLSEQLEEAAGARAPATSGGAPPPSPAATNRPSRT